MPNNKDSMIKKLGSEEAYREFMSKIGKRGGSWKGRKGTATFDPKFLKKIGSKGGRNAAR